MSQSLLGISHTHYSVGDGERMLMVEEVSRGILMTRENSNRQWRQQGGLPKEREDRPQLEVSCCCDRAISGYPLEKKVFLVKVLLGLSRTHFVFFSFKA